MNRLKDSILTGPGALHHFSDGYVDPVLYNELWSVLRSFLLEISINSTSTNLVRYYESIENRIE